MRIQERIRENVSVLDIDGPITSALESPDKVISATVRRLLAKGRRLFLLNLDGVPYIDSTALAEIVEAYLTTTRQGGALKLERPSPQIREILRVTRLATVLTVFDSEASAVASFTDDKRKES